MDRPTRTPRSMRNNNPLNIRRGKVKWEGMSATQADPHFVQFETMAHGWRAAFILLARTYYFKYGLNTPQTIIARWAPAADGNDVQAYVERVCQLTGYASDTPLGVPSMEAARWMKLATAMAIVEGGTESLDYFAMLDGWAMMRDMPGNKFPEN